MNVRECTSATRAPGRVPVGLGVPARPRSRVRLGVALVLVLLVTLLLGLIALSLAFTVTLDSLGARNVQEAALAEGQAEGALALAVAEVATLAPSELIGGLRLGPWPAAGLHGHADVVLVAPGTVRVRGRAAVGRSAVERTAVVRFDAAGELHLLARP